MTRGSPVLVPERDLKGPTPATLALRPRRRSQVKVGGT